MDTNRHESTGSSRGCLHSPGKGDGAILDGNPCKQREPQSESARLRVLYPFPRRRRFLAVPAVPSCQTNVYRGLMHVRGRTGGPYRPCPSQCLQGCFAIQLLEGLAEIADVVAFGAGFPESNVAGADSKRAEFAGEPVKF